MGAGKATRSCVRKLRRYAHLKSEIQKISASATAAESSSSSKGKNTKASSSSSKGKRRKTNDKLLTEMEGWIMGRNDITVQTKEEIDMLVEISKKHGHYNGSIKVRASNPEVKNYIKTQARREKLEFK